MLPTFPHAAQTHRNWLDACSAHRCSDPRFEVRLADPDDFPAVYDLLDEAFGTARPRALRDWLYLDNPRGRARCIVLVDRSNGDIVSCGSLFPWPLAFGNSALDGTLGGDSATRPDLRRQGIRQLVDLCWEDMPWTNERCDIGWPNRASLALFRKHGRPEPIGVLNRVVLPLRSLPILRRGGWPNAAARLVGPIVDQLYRLQRSAIAHSSQPTAIEAIDRFDSAIDAVTAQTMGWIGYWSPHDAEFLNWRYRDHPLHEYHALAALTEQGDPIGYTVVRVDGPRAWLMELAAPAHPATTAIQLWRRAVELALEAGCETLDFAATPRLPYWKILKRAGMRKCPSELFLSCGCGRGDERDFDAWQLVPGDIETL